MDHKNSSAEVAKPSKGALQYRRFTRKLISLRREPVVQASQTRLLEVPANL
jgi:hypothetical protein